LLLDVLELDRLHRLADFTIWGCAISEALGADHSEFLEAMAENVRMQSDESIKASLIATVLIAWIDSKQEGVWRGTPQGLYDELCEYADLSKISIRQKAWPKTANWMDRRLNDVKPNLLAAGYFIEKDRSSKGRVITVRKTSGNSVHGVTGVTSGDANDANDTTLDDFKE
jgi:hypothetical protein